MSLATVLDAATDDTLLAIAVALPTPADLLRMRSPAAPRRSASTSPPRATAAQCPAAPRQRSRRRPIMEEAAYEAAYV
jgi:hypothetical protein